MSASDQDLAGLPADVREAAVRWDDVAERFGPESSGSRDWATIRAELLRLDRECQDRIRQALENGHRAERAETELATIKQRIAEAPVAELRCRDATWVLWPTADRGMGSLIGQRVALLPTE